MLGSRFLPLINYKQNCCSRSQPETVIDFFYILRLIKGYRKIIRERERVKERERKREREKEVDFRVNKKL